MIKIALISSTVIVSSPLFLSSCDDKLKQEKRKGLNGALDSLPNLGVKKHKQSKVVSSTLDSSKIQLLRKLSKKRVSF